MFLENSVHGNKQFGSIEVICGSMFSGKTEELIRRLKRAKIANQKIQIFKPSLDSRNNEYIESHDKNTSRFERGFWFRSQNKFVKRNI